jgi:trimethylguanosine synthase
MQPYSLDLIYTAYSKITSEIILYLPRTSDLNQIAQYVPKGKQLPVVHYCIGGASKVNAQIFCVWKVLV